MQMLSGCKPKMVPFENIMEEEAIFDLPTNQKLTRRQPIHSVYSMYLVADPDVGVALIVPVRELPGGLLPLPLQEQSHVLPARVLRHLLGGAPFLKQQKR